MLGGLGGTKAGCRTLPRQFMCGLAVPLACDVPERAAHGDDNPFSWRRVGQKPMWVYVSCAPFMIALCALLIAVSGCAQFTAGWSFAEGRNAYNRGDYATAEREWSKALRAMEKTNPEDPDTAFFNEQLARVENALGKYTEAEQYAAKAIAIRTKLSGPNDASLAHPLYEMAQAVYYQGRYADAAPIFRRAVPVVEKKLGTDKKGLIGFLEFFSSCLHKAGLAAEASEIDQRIKSLRHEKES